MGNRSSQEIDASVSKGKGQVDHLEARERNSLFSEMAPTALVKKKAGSIPESKPVKTRKPRPPPKSVEVPSSDDEEDSEDENESDEEDGVDEIGFEKLIKALGDDGLNEYDQAHLVSLAGDEEHDEESGEGEDVEDEELGEVSSSGEDGEEVPEEDDGAGEGGPGSSSEAEEGGSFGNEDVLALDELEDVELHPDAVPRRGVKVIDNKVRAARIQLFSYFIIRCLGCSREDQENDPARPQTTLDRNPCRLISRSSYCRPRG